MAGKKQMMAHLHVLTSSLHARILWFQEPGITTIHHPPPFLNPTSEFINTWASFKSKAKLLAHHTSRGWALGLAHGNLFIRIWRQGFYWVRLYRGAKKQTERLLLIVFPSSRTVREGTGVQVGFLDRYHRLQNPPEILEVQQIQV